MGKQEQEKTVQEEVTLEELNKSWEDSRAAVLDLLGEAPSVEPVEKAETETEESVEETVEKAGDEKMEYDEEEEDEDDEEEKVEKSVEGQIEQNEEVAAALDVEPFLREIAKAIDNRFSEMEKSLEELGVKVEASENLQKATSRMFAAFGELQKATADTVEKIGNTPIKSSSVKTVVGDRFEKSQDENQVADLNMNRDQILDKALKLREAGKLQIRDVTKIEGRLNKGMELPEDIKQILIKEEV